jgi:hypothetical protein
MVTCYFRAYDKRHQFSVPSGTVGQLVAIDPAYWDGVRFQDVATVMFAHHQPPFSARVRLESLQLAGGGPGPL